MSTITSSFGINPDAKWQFINRAHPPRPALSFMQLIAFLSCPLPKEIASYFLDIFISSANRLKSATGSDPGERTKIKGVVAEESLYDFATLKVGGIIYYSPIFSFT